MDDKVRAIIDRIKDTAEVVGEAAGNAAKQAGKQAGETFELAKLNMKIFDLNGEISSDYKAIGKLVYAAHIGEDTDEGEIDTLIANVDAKNEEISGYRERITLLKKTVSCPNCGSACSKDDVFCKKCGAAIVK